MQAIKIIAFTLWLAMLCTSVYPVEGKLPTASRSESRQGRKQEAKDLLATVNRFGDTLRTPLPSEVAWVEAEELAIGRISDRETRIARQLQLIEMVAFQQVNIHRQVQNIRDAFHCIIDSSTSTQREVYCWAVASYLLGDEALLSDGVRVLLLAKRIPEEVAQRVGIQGDGRGLALIYGLYARDIQQKIVIPFLRGDLK